MKCFEYHLLDDRLVNSFHVQLVHEDDCYFTSVDESNLFRVFMDVEFSHRHNDLLLHIGRSGDILRYKGTSLGNHMDYYYFGFGFEYIGYVVLVFWANIMFSKSYPVWVIFSGDKLVGSYSVVDGVIGDKRVVTSMIIGLSNIFNFNFYQEVP